jgi:hypothetical protein
MPGIQKEYKDHRLEEEQNLRFLVRHHVESCDSSEVESKSGEIGRGSCFSVLGSESENEIECEGDEIGRGSCFSVLEIESKNEIERKGDEIGHNSCFSALEINHSDKFGLGSWSPALTVLPSTMTTMITLAICQMMSN